MNELRVNLRPGEEEHDIKGEINLGTVKNIHG